MKTLYVPTRKLNRLRSRLPKTSKPYWCVGCDRAKVRQGEKCESCGYIDGNKRLKKKENP